MHPSCSTLYVARNRCKRPLPRVCSRRIRKRNVRYSRAFSFHSYVLACSTRSIARAHTFDIASHVCDERKACSRPVRATGTLHPASHGVRMHVRTGCAPTRLHGLASSVGQHCTWIDSYNNEKFQVGTGASIQHKVALAMRVMARAGGPYGHTADAIGNAQAS